MKIFLWHFTRILISSEKIMHPRLIQENHASENHPRKSCIRETSEKSCHPENFTHPRNMPSEIQISLLFKFCLSIEFLVSEIDLRYFLWSGLFRSETGQNFIWDQHTVKCLSYFTIFDKNLCFFCHMNFSKMIMILISYNGAKSSRC